VLELTAAEIDTIGTAAVEDWSAVDVSISGTLFERGLNPAKRSQLGSHYTSRAHIETIVEPVVLAPLRREWAAVRAKAEPLLAVSRNPPPAAPASKPAATKVAPVKKASLKLVYDPRRGCRSDDELADGQAATVISPGRGACCDSIGGAESPRLRITGTGSSGLPRFNPISTPTPRTPDSASLARLLANHCRYSCLLNQHSTIKAFGG
jgi:hypothetical protein